MFTLIKQLTRGPVGVPLWMIAELRAKIGRAACWLHGRPGRRPGKPAKVLQESGQTSGSNRACLQHCSQPHSSLLDSMPPAYSKDLADKAVLLEWHMLSVPEIAGERALGARGVLLLIVLPAKVHMRCMLCWGARLG